MYALRQAEWSSKAFLVQDLQTSASVSLPNRFLTILWAYHLAFFCNPFFSWKKEGHREQGDKEALQYLDDWLCQRSSVCGRGRLNLFWLIFSQKIWLIFSQKVFENCRERQQLKRIAQLPLELMKVAAALWNFGLQLCAASSTLQNLCMDPCTRDVPWGWSVTVLLTSTFKCDSNSFQ